MSIIIFNWFICWLIGSKTYESRDKGQEPLSGFICSSSCLLRHATLFSVEGRPCIASCGLSDYLTATTIMARHPTELRENLRHSSNNRGNRLYVPFLQQWECFAIIAKLSVWRLFKIIHDGEAGKLKDSRTEYNFDLLKRETKEPAACCWTSSNSDHIHRTLTSIIACGTVKRGISLSLLNPISEEDNPKHYFSLRW